MKPRYRVGKTPSGYLKVEQRVEGCDQCHSGERWQTRAYVYFFEGSRAFAEKVVELLNADADEVPNE